MTIKRNCDLQQRLGRSAALSLIMVIVLVHSASSQTFRSASVEPSETYTSLQTPTAVLLSDNFKQDSSLNTNKWTISSAFLENLASASSSPAATYVTPSLAFSRKSGMQMSGPTEDYETTGVQSLSTFTAPFTVVANVTSTEGTADPFEIFLASADLTQFVTVTCNVNPAYYGFWATSPNVSQLWQAGEQFSPPISPQFNTRYTVVIKVNAKGIAKVKISSGGKVLGTLSGLQTGGVGPFYLVLGQRIGNAEPAPQGADWFSAKVTTP